MMWMPFTMDGNKQKGNWLIVEHKALKWAKMNSGPPKYHLHKFPWQMGWLWHCLHNYDDYKIMETQLHKMHEQRGWIIWCPHLLHEIFEIWPPLNTEL